MNGLQAPRADLMFDAHGENMKNIRWEHPFPLLPKSFLPESLTKNRCHSIYKGRKTDTSIKMKTTRDNIVVSTRKKIGVKSFFSGGCLCILVPAGAAFVYPVLGGKQQNPDAGFAQYPDRHTPWLSPWRHRLPEHSFFSPCRFTTPVFFHIPFTEYGLHTE